jgi:SSS family transporter
LLLGNFIFLLIVNLIDLSQADVLAFVGYLVIACTIGYFVGRKKSENAADFFLAGRSLPWYVVGCSYIAANISTEHFIGLVGAAVIYGMCVATGEWSSIIAFTFLIWLYIPFLMSSKVYTAPEYLEKRFNRSMRIVFAVVTLIVNVFGFLGPILYGGALVIEQLFGVSIILSIIIIAACSAFWAIWGGLKAIAAIDVLTVVTMIIGGLSVTFIGLNYLGDGAGIVVGVTHLLEANKGVPEFADRFIREAVPHILKGSSTGDPYNRLSVIQPLNHYATPWTHWVLSFFYIGLWYTVINQHMIQKVLAAKNMYHARLGMVLASILKLLLPLIIVVPGLIFFAMNPVIQSDETASAEQIALIEQLGLAEQLNEPSYFLNPSDTTLIIEMEAGAEVVLNAQKARDGELSGQAAEVALEQLSALRFAFISEWSNKSYVLLIQQMVPPFLLGLILAALFGSVQSTVSSVINSTSTVFTMDVYRTFIRPQASETEEICVGRIAGFFILILSILTALLLAEITKVNLFVYTQTLFVFFAPPFSAIFLVGSLWRRVSGRDALNSTLVALAFAVVLKVLEFGFPGALPHYLLPFANQGVLVWLVSMLTIFVSAMLTAPPSAEQTTQGLVVQFKELGLSQSAGGGLWYQSVTLWWGACVFILCLLVIVFSVYF